MNETMGLMGAGMTLSVGGMALGTMETMPGVAGTGLTQKVAGTGANMMGAVVPTVMGFSMLKYVDQQTRQYQGKKPRFK